MPSRIGLACALVVAGGLALLAQPVDRQRAEAMDRRAGERLAALRAESERLAAEQQTVLGDLRRLEVLREMRSLELTRARTEAERVAAEVAELDARVSDLQAQVDSTLPDIRARLVTLYKLGRGQYARLLLSATDGRQFAQAVRLATAVAEQDRRQLTEFRAQRDRLAQSMAATAARQADLRGLEAAAAAAERAAAGAVEAHLALVRQVEARRELTERYAGELQASQRRLQAALAGFASPSSLALPLTPFKGDLDWPVPGTVRQRFGSTVGNRPALRGIEIGAPAGAAVHAVHDGLVAYAAPFTGFGRLVIVDHGNQNFSLYGNLGEFQVQQGARVVRGDPVGTVGLATDGTEAMYFELRVDGQAVDPLQWLAQR